MQKHCVINYLENIFDRWCHLWVGKISATSCGVILKHTLGVEIDTFSVRGIP